MIPLFEFPSMMRGCWTSLILGVVLLPLLNPSQSMTTLQSLMAWR